jgi:hypothetical protein
MGIRRWSMAVAVALAGCSDESDQRGDDAWEPSSDEAPDDDGSEAPAEDGDTGSEDDTGGVDDPTMPGESDDGVDDSTTGPGFDCSPWQTVWIGAPCANDGECAYDGGVCLREDQGFPCGTCSQPCDQLCPDLEGAPETFCVDAADVGLPSAGNCLSKCDVALLGGDGCRDGYGCGTLPRFNEAQVEAAVCVPDPFVPPPTDCASQLDALGATWEPTSHDDESPDGYPDLVCSIAEPVHLYEPAPGLTLRYVEDDSPGHVLLGCEAALAVARSSVVAVELGAVEWVHYGTYNCRPISGTNTLSEHAFANAIDIYGFELDDGSFWTIIDHWEDFAEAPSTPGGSWLRDWTDAIWEMGFWNILLTPEYNDAHDNHVHADLTPGGNYYYWE